MKIWAILGGGDWFDASVDHLILPEGIDIEKEYEKHQDWYNNEYCPPAIKKIEYMDFTDWLKRLGAREPTKDELEYSP